MKKEELRTRTKNFMNTLHLPISRFAKTIGIARETYYRWINGDFDFGETRAKAVDEFISQFGF